MKIRLRGFINEDGLYLLEIRSPGFWIAFTKEQFDNLPQNVLIDRFS